MFPTYILNCLQVSSPQKGHRTGTDGLLRESEPGGFTEVRTSPSSISVLTVAQPLSLEEESENQKKVLRFAIAMLESQPSPMNPMWHAKFSEEFGRFEKYVVDNMCDETRRTLPKTNERDRRNQPLPANIIGRHFGTSKRHGYTGQ